MATEVKPQGVTAQLAGAPGQVRAGATVADETDVRDWLGGTMKAAVSEETAGLGAYGKVLTVLSSNMIGCDVTEDNDEEDEDELIERWTPRFH